MISYKSLGEILGDRVIYPFYRKGNALNSLLSLKDKHNAH